MKLLIPLLLLSFHLSAADTTFFKADHPYIQYTGRIDFTDPAAPRFWQPGVYIKLKFKGSHCTILMDDEAHNYLAVQVDNLPAKRFQISGKHNMINITDHLDNGDHVLTICKNTEAGIGYLQFIGVKCQALLPLPAKPVRKIEFIGNSVTCGSGADQSSFPCGQGQWFDQHNAWMSYGPITARALKAQWQLASVSGIGLIQSCCGMPFTMPQVYDKINMRADSIQWDFSKYQPDVVAVCLGENDGIQDSVIFCNAYKQFINTIKQHYPKVTIICLSSAMADEQFKPVLERYITAIIKNNKNVYHYFFTKQYGHGCGGHPDLQDHKEIATGLTNYIKKIKKWG
jgi:lysophospholipase L1-like esterase